MNTQGFDFLEFILANNLLKKINFPLPGCMVIKTNDRSIIGCYLLEEVMDTFDDSIEFYESPSAKNIQSWFENFMVFRKTNNI